MADFNGNLVEGAADDCKRRDVGGVAVALNDLRGDERWLETEAPADFFFLFWAEMSECTNSAGELANAHVLGGSGEAGCVALHFGVPVEQLEAKSGGLGVDSVGAAYGGRVLELDGAALEHGEESGDAVAKKRGCFFDLEGLGSVDNVVRSEAVMQPSGLGVETLGFETLCHCGCEGDDVVLDFGFDFGDAGGGDGGLGGDGGGGARRNDAVVR